MRVLHDLVCVARAWAGLRLIRLGALVAGAREGSDTRVWLPNDDLDDEPTPPPCVVVTPAALALVAVPEPRRKEAESSEPLEGSLAAQLRRR